MPPLQGGRHGKVVLGQIKCYTPYSMSRVTPPPKHEKRTTQKRSNGYGRDHLNTVTRVT